MQNGQQGIQSGTAGLAGIQGGYQNASQQAMMNSMQDPYQRETDVYGRMMAAQQPGLDRQNAQMQARAFAQGRGGIAGSQYGGSGEQYAQSRAQMDAQNSAMLGAMGQAQNEMMNQGSLSAQYGQLGNQTAGLQGQLGALGGSLGAQIGQLGQGQAALGQGAAALGSSIGSALDNNAIQAGQLGGLLTNAGAQQAALGLQGYTTGFQPLQTQLDALGLGLQNANLAQTGQIAGANLAGQSALGGIQTDVNAQKAASEVYGNLFGSLGNIISSSDTVDDWLSKIPGLGD
jgi:hypothetical protein